MSDSGLSPTLLYRTYRAATRIFSPAFGYIATRKLQKQLVPSSRIRERLGRTSAKRPSGIIIWFHCASIGESLSVLPLIEQLQKHRPKLNFLITSGTASSAKVLKHRLPKNCQHQFAPIDTPKAMSLFLEHWRPSAGIFVESEIWPNSLIMANNTGAKLALINARLSERSLQGWQRFPQTSAYIFDKFEMILTQNAFIEKGLRRIKAPQDRVYRGLNLKAIAKPLDVDYTERKLLHHQLKDRLLWVASSTHQGEEEIILKAQIELLQHLKDICLILVPRHPERREEIILLLEDSELEYSVRSLSQRITRNTQIYLADTFGEMGLWYSLAKVIFIGGSLLESYGGHNPYEPANFATAILTGPNRTNFSETYDLLIDRGGVIQVNSAKSLAKNVNYLLSNPQKTAEIGAVAESFAKDGREWLSKITSDVLSIIEKGTS
ncbi:MAG: 3-deoxy-D-manno-octulosonic acid transferase [Aestuariivita sp.]|nr:3-deoxy-D-manno-octulosonic acid transferase [Aestuariivita sp.]